MPSPNNFNASLSGSGNTIVPAPAAHPTYGTNIAAIVVTSIRMTASATSVVTVKSGSTTIDIVYMQVGNEQNLENRREGVWRCQPGEALVVDVSAGNVQFSGTYAIVGAG